MAARLDLSAVWLRRAALWLWAGVLPALILAWTTLTPGVSDSTFTCSVVPPHLPFHRSPLLWVFWFADPGGNAPPTVPDVLWKFGLPQLAALLCLVIATHLGVRRWADRPAPRGSLFESLAPALIPLALFMGLVLLEVHPPQRWCDPILLQRLGHRAWWSLWLTGSAEFQVTSAARHWLVAELMARSLMIGLLLLSVTSLLSLRRASAVRVLGAVGLIAVAFQAAMLMADWLVSLVIFPALFDRPAGVSLEAGPQSLLVAGDWTIVLLELAADLALAIAPAALWLLHWTLRIRRVSRSPDSFADPTQGLWARESRGAQRHWWMRPWVVPAMTGIIVTLALLWPESRQAILQSGISGPAHFQPSMSVPLLLRLPLVWLVWLPRALLMLWMVWCVSEAVTREPRRGTADELAVTAIAPRGVACAKTLAPALWSIVLIAALTILEMALLRAVLTLHAGDSEELLQGWRRLLAFRLGEVVPGLTDATVLRTSSAWALTVMDLPLRWLLAALGAATLTAWVSARMRSPAAAFLASLCAVVLVTVAVVAFDRWGYPWLIQASRTLQGLGPIEMTFGEWGAIYVIGSDIPPMALQSFDPAAFLNLVHWLPPLLWLAWWWRWTKRGFLRVWLRRDA